MGGEAGQFRPVWFKDDSSVNTGQTKTVHELPLADFKSVHYILTFFNHSQGVTKTLHLAIINESGLTYTVYGKVGTLPIAVTPKIVGSNLEIEINNPNAYTVQVEIAFAPLGQA